MDNALEDNLPTILIVLIGVVAIGTVIGNFLTWALLKLANVLWYLCYTFLGRILLFMWGHRVNIVLIGVGYILLGFYLRYRGHGSSSAT